MAPRVDNIQITHVAPELAPILPEDRSVPGMISELEDLQAREFKTRDMYNRLVNEIKMLAKSIDEVVDPEGFLLDEEGISMILDEITRIVNIYDPAE